MYLVFPTSPNLFVHICLLQSRGRGCGVCGFSEVPPQPHDCCVQSRGVATLAVCDPCTPKVPQQHGTPDHGHPLSMRGCCCVRCTHPAPGVGGVRLRGLWLPVEALCAASLATSFISFNAAFACTPLVRGGGPAHHHA